MKIEIVQYGDVLDAGTGVRTLAGKFVQIRKADAEYLVFSPKEISAYHADIVERFCREREIRGRYNGQGKKFIISDPEWTVIGGGKFEISTAGRYIRLYDNSMAYGRFESRDLKEKIRNLDEFRNYEVRIQ